MPSVDALVKVLLAALRVASKLPFNAWKALGTSKMDWKKKKKSTLSKEFSAGVRN